MALRTGGSLRFYEHRGFSNASNIYRRERFVSRGVLACDHGLRRDGIVDAILKSALPDIAAASEMILTNVVPLVLPRDRPAMEFHFAALDGEDLRYRFCGSIKPQSVTRYLDRLRGSGVDSFGIFNSRLALVAVSQLAPSTGDLEVAISVLPDFRRSGFATALLEHSAGYARERGLTGLVIHTLADNTPMLSLARRIGMNVRMLKGDADGRLRLRADALFEPDCVRALTHCTPLEPAARRAIGLPAQPLQLRHGTFHDWRQLSCVGRARACRLSGSR